jgi:FkbH-like protein
MSLSDTNPLLSENLPWLPAAPPDFNQQCRSLKHNEKNQLDRVKILAGYSLDSSQLSRLARTLKTINLSSDDTSGLIRFKLGISSNGTLEHLKPIMEASALRHSVMLDVICGGYGQSVQDAKNPNSDINQACPDGVLIALDYRGLPFYETYEHQFNSPLNSSTESAISYLNMIADGFKKNGIETILVQSVVPPPLFQFGNLDRQLDDSLRGQIIRFNQDLAQLCRDKGWILLDLESIAGQVGLERWHDPVKWHMAKLPFDPLFAPLFGDHVARLLAAILGRTRKCLVLDLDNTIWGGVIGDDGMDGINLGQGDSIGEAFVAVQRAALDLKQRGIILAVCSKNEEQTARQPFREHKEMILKEGDITVFIANWHPKSLNLELIAKKLNIGLDALVLLDDNPAERSQVRQALPQIAIPELPDDPAFFPSMLLNGGWFETVRFTHEDRIRTKQYKEQEQRTILKENSPDLASYLKFLKMRAYLAPFDSQGRTRITQLINKTNQFNLTDRRFNESQILEFEQDNSFFTLQVRLKDCFGDNGIISVVICECREDSLYIHNWVMSCRVFNRELEYAIINEIVKWASQEGINEVLGEFVPTQRNKVVEKLFENLGFQPSDTTDSLWRLSISTFEPMNHAIHIEGYGGF